MEKRVLLITEKQSMLVNALAQGLEKDGLQVVLSPTDLRLLPTVVSPPQVLLFYLQNTAQDIPLRQRMEPLHTYMQNRLERREEVLLFLIGNADELLDAKAALPDGYIHGSFSRPFRAEDVAETILKTISEDDEIPEQKSILVVDDDAVMLRTLKESLSQNYKVYTANSGMNAIQLLMKTKVDLILLDYEMPVVKGPQVMEMLRSDPLMKDIPVMFLTAKSDRHSVTEILNLNPENYLLKSLPQKSIVTAIANFFAEK
ncbi:MAG: response regulator [Lachnospiraceae bacterium]|nr:response regulator [Lachnospiraceae bacterium]